MNTIGQIERATQNRVVRLFRESLGYDYLGNWEDRAGNHNIEELCLRPFLKKEGYSETIINRALYELKKNCGRPDQKPLRHQQGRLWPAALRRESETRCGREHRHRPAD